MLEKGEYVLQLVAKEGITAAALSSNDVVLVLDTNVTPELEAEGVRNDFVRAVQQERKNRELHVSDRIALTFETDEETAATLRQHADYIQSQVLATTMTRLPSIVGEAVGAKVGSGEGKPVRLAVLRA